MERPINNIDDLLSRRLQNAEVPPPPFVWPNVERELRRRKRRFFVWFLLAGLAGAGVWTVWSRPFSPVVPAAKESVRTTLPPAQPDAPQAAAPLKTQTGTTAPGSIPPASESPIPAYQERTTFSARGAATPAIKAAVMPPTASSIPENVSSVAETRPSPEISETAAPIAKPSDLSVQNEVPTLLPHSGAALDARLRKPAMPSVHPRVSKKKAPRRCYDFHTNRQAWLLDAYAGPSLVHKSLETGNPEYHDYIDDRQQTEQHEIAFNAGLRASYLFAENFVVRTGLHYDQFTEKFEYIDPNFINTTIRIRQNLVNGQWVTVTDTVIEYGSNYVKTYNRFGMLDIPLQAGLELRNGPTGISLNLGGSLNILFWKRGSMLDLDGNPAKFTPEKQQFDVFQPRVGLSLLGSIQWYYHLGPKTRVFAEPYYRHILEPVTKPGYPVKQNYGIGGIRFGVTKILDAGP